MFELIAFIVIVVGSGFAFYFAKRRREKRERTKNLKMAQMSMGSTAIYSIPTFCPESVRAHIIHRWLHLEKEK